MIRVLPLALTLAAGACLADAGTAPFDAAAAQARYVAAWHSDDGRFDVDALAHLYAEDADAVFYDEFAAKPSDWSFSRAFPVGRQPIVPGLVSFRLEPAGEARVVALGSDPRAPDGRVPPGRALRGNRSAEGNAAPDRSLGAAWRPLGAHPRAPLSSRGGAAVNSPAVGAQRSAWKPRATAALAALWISTALGWSWPWGILFLVLTWSTLRLGETTLLEPVSRRTNPVLFFLITATWALLSVSLIAWDLARWFAPEWLARFGV